MCALGRRVSGVATLVAATIFSAGCVNAAAAPVSPLPPNAQGYVRVETKSGAIRCSINTELVACETSADNWPINTASINANGEFHWVKADLGELAGRVTLDYQTYSAQGWTIVASPGTTTFTNDGSGHGMTVSEQNVAPF